MVTRESEVSLEAVEIRSRVGLTVEECTPSDVVTSVAAFISRDHGPEDVRGQVLLMTPAEMRELYDRMTLYYTQGIWSVKSVREDEPA